MAAGRVRRWIGASSPVPSAASDAKRKPSTATRDRMAKPQMSRRGPCCRRRGRTREGVPVPCACRMICLHSISEFRHRSSETGWLRRPRLCRSLPVVMKAKAEAASALLPIGVSGAGHWLGRPIPWFGKRPSGRRLAGCGLLPVGLGRRQQLIDAAPVHIHDLEAPPLPAETIARGRGRPNWCNANPATVLKSRSSGQRRMCSRSNASAAEVQAVDQVESRLRASRCPVPRPPRGSHRRWPRADRSG